MADNHDKTKKASGIAEAKQQGRKLLSIVVPCFNEQEVIALTHERILSVLGGRPDLELELIYIDDGSSDNTSAILYNIARSYQRVTILTLTRNFGHQAAVSAGLHYASGDAIVVIDADLQDPPEVIPELIAKWYQGYDVVYAIRVARRESPAKRAAYHTFYRSLKRLSDIDIPLDSGDFALINRKAVDLLNSLPEKARFIRALRAWIGLSQVGVPYERPQRAAGVPKYSPQKLIALAIDGVLSSSSKPLWAIFILGLVASSFSIFGIIFYVTWLFSGIHLFGRSPTEVPGFTTIILVIFLASGIQLIGIGVIGAYIGRVYDEVKGRPTYLLKEITRSQDIESC